MILYILSIATLSAPELVPVESETIVVTARSIVDTERELIECLARHCPPKDDIEASLAHAENLFLAGDFAKARATLGRSRNRNIRYAKDLPIEVSDLARAYGRMSTFDGYENLGRMAQIDSLDALKEGLDGGDARILVQRLMVGDEFVRAGRLDAGEDVYNSVEKQARKAGLPYVVGLTMLRQAVVFGAIASVEPLYRPQARAKILRLEHTTEPELAEFREGVSILKARLAAIGGDERAVNDAIDELRKKHPPSRPTLVYAPEIDLDPAATSGSSGVSIVGNAQPQWVDVAFEIDNDGRVQHTKVVRKSSNVSGVWPQRVSAALLKRRYTPPGSNAVTERIERFAFVYNVTDITGSRIRARSPIGRIVSLDLTIEP